MNLTTLNMTQKIKQGEIWLANLNPSKGTEPGKVRPVLLLQSQTLIEVNHPSTLIVPLTTKLIKNAEPLRIRITAQDELREDSDILIDQLRAIDNKRLITGPLTRLTKKKLQSVYNAIHEIMNINDYHA